MTPIDVTAKNPIPGQDPIEMLRAIMKAFMLLLNRQPNCLIEFNHQELASFPYGDFRLASFSDYNGNQTFMLVRSDDAEVH